MNIFRIKPISTLLDEAQRKSKLKKVLGVVDLTALGIGAIIGTGIFVITGVAAAKYAGPGIILSFVLSALACTFAALCYAEFASMIPIAGSAYTYGYAALGEFWAWLIGWNLILEYLVANAAVAIGWSGYIVNLLNVFGIKLPAWAVNSPGTAPGALMNLPAVIAIVLISSLLIRGVKESAKFNNVIVVIKLSVILLFIVVGAFFVKPVNYTPFLPYGVKGVFTGAAIVFFAYIGFDAVSTAAEEVKNPQRNLPLGIIISLAVSTTLYIIVAALLTGIAPYKDYYFQSAPVAYAMNYVGQGWMSGIISIGALAGITSVLLVFTLGQTRIFYAMSRDGLLPKAFGKLSSRSNTPINSTIITAIIASLIAAFVPINIIAELTNIGTLTAFIIVSIAVIVLRYKKPEINRPFRVPLVPYIPILAVIFCFALMLSLPLLTWIRFVVWLVIGIIVYFSYSYRNSRLNLVGDIKP